MKLFYRETGQGEPIIIMHGLFGAGDNWFSVARLLEEEYRVILPDARNHGQSPHTDDFTYSGMAEDLADLLDELGLEKALFVGHSMGGKAVMNFAVRHPERVMQLVVVDIAPRHYPVHHQTILKAFSSIDVENLKSRGDADKAMAAYIRDPGTRQFLLKNLSRAEEGGYEWKLNLPVVRDQIENVGEPLPEGSRYDKPTLFINGSQSDYIQPQKDRELIKQHFPQARIETIEGAGHWVHAEKPEEIVQLMKGFFSENG